MEDDVTIAEASVRPRCNLYAYRITESAFDDLALAAYFASGKFDKTTIHRWTAGKLLTNPHKAQNFRASVDNTVVLLPVDRVGETHVRGHVFLLCYSTDDDATAVVAIGVASQNPFEIQSPYARVVVPVHVVTTLCGSVYELRRRSTWNPHPSLPSNVFLLVDDLADAVAEVSAEVSAEMSAEVSAEVSDLSARYDDGENNDEDNEYVRQKLMALDFVRVIHHARTLKTPSPMLESDRLRRLDILKSHFEQQTWTKLPPTRRAPDKKIHGLRGVLKTYEKHASMFGKLFPTM